MAGLEGLGEGEGTGEDSGLWENERKGGKGGEVSLGRGRN